MKTIILTLVLSFTGFTTFSQIPTLTMQNSGPQPGDILVSHFADTTGIIIGSSGANHRWDYSNLIIGTLKHEEDYTTSYISYFPGATASYYYSAGMKNVIKVDTVEYSILAVLDQPVYYMAPLTIMVYSEPQKLFTYPFNFSDEIINHFAGSISQYYQGLAPTYREGTSTTIADGWGMLLLPSGIFNNVLRVKIIVDYTDSTVMTNPPSVFIKNVHIEKYLWYDGIHKNPLLKIEFTPGIKDSMNVIIKSVLVAEGINGINNLIDRGLNLNIYPNPASTEITIEIPASSAPGCLIIYNLQGQELLSSRISGTITKIDISKLPVGIYFARLTGEETVEVRKIIKE